MLIINIWEFIEETKDKNPEQQREYMFNKLTEIDDELVIKDLECQWDKLRDEMIGGEFIKLQFDHGGIIEADDAYFFIDFACWVIGRGKRLYDDFMLNGHKAIVKYIEYNQIPDEECLYESLDFAFDDAKECLGISDVSHELFMVNRSMRGHCIHIAQCDMKKSPHEIFLKHINKNSKIARNLKDTKHEHILYLVEKRNGQYSPIHLCEWLHDEGEWYIDVADFAYKAVFCASFMRTTRNYWDGIKEKALL